MKTKFKLIVILVGMILLFAISIPAFAQNNENLLRNPDFEQGTYDYEFNPAQKVPGEWAPWWVSPVDGCYNFAPKYTLSIVPARVQSGNQSITVWQGENDFGFSYDGGLAQTGIEAVPGAVYEFSIWGHSWSTDDRGSQTSAGPVTMQVGIDPSGGSNALAGTVVWSDPSTAIDSFSLFSVEATASGNTISVFTRARPEFCFLKNDVYWDNASLILTSSPGDITPTPTITPTPDPDGLPSTEDVLVGSIPISEPDQLGQVFHTVNPGETLVGIVDSYDVRYGPGLITKENVRRLNNLTGDLITAGDELLIIEAGVLPGYGIDVDPEPTEVAEVIPEDGTLCLVGFNDQNEDGEFDSTEDLIADVEFTISRGTTDLEFYTTDGITEPYCIPNLEPGLYIVSWGDDEHIPTTDQVWTVEVPPGDTVSNEFGIRLVADLIPTEVPVVEETVEPLEDESQGGLPVWVTAVIGAVGVILFLSGLGAAGYFLMSRREQPDW